MQNLKPIFIGVKELAHIINAVPGSINNLKFPNSKYRFNKYRHGSKVVFKLIEVEEWAESLQPVTSQPKLLSESELALAKPRRGRPRKTAPTAKGGV